MTDFIPNKNLINIRNQIDLLKQKLDNIDKTLGLQEEALDLLEENSKSLIKDILPIHRNIFSTDEVMKNAFSKHKLPRILFKKR